jgi:DNA-binding LytR/AlgR family response regulator
MPVTCAIVDDSEEDRGKLIRLLHDVPDVQVSVSAFSSAEELLAGTCLYDVYVLDIDMPGMNGIELAEKISCANPNAAILFCSSYEQLVFEAMRTDAIFFIRKRHLREDFPLALQKILRRIRGNQEVFAFQEDGALKKLAYRSILYFEVRMNDIYIHEERKVHRIRRSMKSLQKEVARSEFCLIHVSYLVNFQHVTEIRRKEAVMDNGEVLPVSAAHAQGLRNAYHAYLIHGDIS